MAFVFLLTLLLTVLLPSNGSAEPVTVFGLGAKACGAFIDAKAQLSPDYRAFQSWVAGFLTGINRMLAADQLDMIQGVNFEAVEASIEQRCREHPAETFFAVAGAVAADLLIRSRPNP